MSEVIKVLFVAFLFLVIVFTNKRTLVVLLHVHCIDLRFLSSDDAYSNNTTALKILNTSYVLELLDKHACFNINKEYKVWEFHEPTGVWCCTQDFYLNRIAMIKHRCSVSRSQKVQRLIITSRSHDASLFDIILFQRLSLFVRGLSSFSVCLR